MPGTGAVISITLHVSVHHSLYLRLAAMRLLVRKQQAGLPIQAYGMLIAHVACERP